MASIIKKNIKGNSYYYYVESKRVDGKPRPVNQHYLGSAERILMLATNPAASLQEKALFSDVEDFGDVMIVWDIARRLDIAGTIDRHCPKRSQGASVGQYIVTEAVNRAVAPVSTSSIRSFSHVLLCKIFNVHCGSTSEIFSVARKGRKQVSTCGHKFSMLENVLSHGLALVGVRLLHLLRKPCCHSKAPLGLSLLRNRGLVGECLPQTLL